MITIGNLNLSDISEESLLENVTYVGLMSVFFKGTVRENLLLADKQASDERLWSVLSDCNLKGFFENENGLDTLLTENAGNLSGGQKQRLALARALLHDSKVYIFDEATSNVDVESEEVILKEIRELTESRTVIMITHRLANVKEADSILCMKEGRLAGVGTHEELLRDCGEYKKLWEKQKELEEFAKGGTYEETK
jgi:ABC-type multidrug transport system fused ATPase/permease subunit